MIFRVLCFLRKNMIFASLNLDCPVIGSTLKKFKRLFGALKISVITSEVQRIQRIYVEKVNKYAPMQ